MITVTGELKYISQYKQIFLEIDEAQRLKIDKVENKKCYIHTDDESGEATTRVKLSLSKYLKIDSAMMVLEDLVGSVVICEVQLKRYESDEMGPCVAWMCRSYKKKVGKK